MIYTNEKGLPKQFVLAMENDDYTGPKADSNVISVTKLLGSPLVRYLEKKHHDKLKRDVSDSLWLLLGKGVHHILELGADKDDLFEVRLEIDVDGMTVSGAFDYYNSLLKRVEDYKVTSVYAVADSERLKEYAKQMQIYAYMIKTKLGLPVESIVNNFILRDLSKITERTTGINTNFFIYEQEMISNAETYEMIKERVKLHSSDEIKCCTPDERFAEENTIKVYREGAKKALKVFKENTSDDTIELFIQKEIAKAKAAKGKDRKNYSIVKVEGDRWKKCDKYCSCAEFCPAYKAKDENWTSKK